MSNILLSRYTPAERKRAKKWIAKMRNVMRSGYVIEGEYTKEKRQSHKG